MTSGAIARASHVRLAVAFAHAVPGGTIELRTDDGSVLRASHDCTSGATITPCELRAALVSRACPLWPGVMSHLADIAISGGDLVDLGGGVYARVCPEGAEQRWFATFLAPSTVRRILDDCPLELPDHLDASLRPDVELGVVVTILSTGDPALRSHLDDAARWASAACYAQELLHAARSTSEAS